ncbi:MAG: permease [Betaproteobacteria bacterium]
MSALTEHSANRVNFRLWGIAGIAAILWLFLYNVIHPLSEWISYEALGLARGSHAGEAIAFFFYDVPKIMLLVSGMIFVITVLRTFFSAERARRLLSGKRVGIGNVLASALGIVTPFCSCSAVPLFIGFVEAGIPLGVTFSFLVAAPVINEVALVLLYGMFGWKVAALYVTSGMIIAIVTGLFIGRLGVERWVEDFVWQMQVRGAEDDSGKLSWEERFARAREAVWEIVQKVWLYVLIGIGIGAGIHGYVPTDAMAAYMGKDAAWWAVPLVVIMALPLYSNAAGMAPILLALVEKGAALGTALAFMMAVVGVSLPETILLRRVLKPQLIAMFIGIVTVAIIVTGYLFNLIL